MRLSNATLLSCLSVLLLLSATASAIAQQADQPQSQTLEAGGRVTAVTVYRGQALVTREIALQPRGRSLIELVVTDLPERIIPGSLFAEIDRGTVRAVRYRARAVQEEPREDVRQLTAAIEEVQRLIRENNAKLELIAQRSAYLTSLEKFSAEKVTDEASRGTLNADALIKMTEFLFRNRAELSSVKLATEEEAQKLQEQLKLHERRRGELAGRLNRTAREAVVSLEAAGEGNITLRLNYAVSNASWSPSYNLRGRGELKEMNLEYIAQVQQMTGEDWNGVQLTLSTASPAMTAEGPTLAPLWVVLTSAGQSQSEQGPGWVQEQQKAANIGLSQAIERRAQSPQQPNGLDFEANTYGNQLQLLDLIAGREALFGARGITVGDSALSVTYTLPAAISLPSRNDQQMIQIASLTVPAETYYVATPLLTPYVYQQALISNTSNIALLAGPMTAYVDGQFMGQGQIPLVAKGQRFVVGLGVETQLRASRELVDKTEQTQGGNRVMDFKYRLLIENYTDKPVQVRVFDRLPEPTSKDIRLTIGESSAPISKDAVYARTLQKSGIQRWDVEVPARASGEQARLIEYSFRLEYDRNLALSEPSGTLLERNRDEFRKSMDAYMMP